MNHIDVTASWLEGWSPKLIFERLRAAQPKLLQVIRAFAYTSRNKDIERDRELVSVYFGSAKGRHSPLCSQLQ